MGASTGIYVQRAFQDEVKAHLDPGTMKGPNAKLPFVDNLEAKINMGAWNNIPLPVQAGFEEIINAFKEFKQCYFKNFNQIVTTQRVVNMNQQQTRTDDNQIRREGLENIELCDQFRDKKLDEQFEKVQQVLKEKQVEIEEKSAQVINQRINQELVMLRQWTENLMRQKINEECRKLRNWATLEFKNVRSIFEIPGVIERAQEPPDAELIKFNQKHSESPVKQAHAPEQSDCLYKDFKEFVLG